MPSSNRTVPSARFLATGEPQGQPGQQEPARVYLIATPYTRKSAAWPMILKDLGRRIKGASLAEFTDVFTDGADYRARWPQVVGELAGAVIVPRIVRGCLMLRSVAVREAEEVSAAGKPVLIYTRKGLFPWAQADVIRPESRPGVYTELIIPGGVR